MGEMKQKKLKAKVVHKHETESNWLLSDYVPDIGEVVFYDPDETHDYTRQKNGDGIKKVHELPFAMPDALLMAGEGIDSIIQPATQNEEDKKKNKDVTNHAPSPATSSFGKANYAGSMGYSIDGTSFNSAGDYDTFYLTEYHDDLAVGDTVTLKIGNSFDEWAKITSIENEEKQTIIEGLAETPIYDEHVTYTAEYDGDIVITSLKMYPDRPARYYLETDYTGGVPFRTKFPDAWVGPDNIIEVSPWYENGIPKEFIEFWWDARQGDSIDHQITIYEVIGDIKYETTTALAITINKPVTLNASNIADYGKKGEGTIRCTEKPYIGNVEIDACQFVAGENNVASGQDAASFGNSNKSVGRYSFTAGAVNTAVFGASSLGYQNQSLGHYSHTQNRKNKATGLHSFAANYCTQANGDNATSFGQETYANGIRSITGGYQTHALADNSGAFGVRSRAEAPNSFTFGRDLKATNPEETVVGKYNNPVEGALFEVGAGSGSTGVGNGKLFNALTVLDTGNVTLGKEPENDKDAATKGYVDNECINLRSSYDMDFGHLSNRLDIVEENTTTTSEKVSTLETQVAENTTQINWTQEVLAQMGAVITETKNSNDNIIAVPDKSLSKAFVDKIGGGCNVTYRALDELNVFDRKLLPTSDGLLR